MANFEPASGQTVLIVEDDPTLRMLAAEIVDDAGFKALEAPDAAAAMSILETRRDVQLVFTDVDMPGSFNGLELALRIRDRWPPIEIVVTSGHPLPQNKPLPTGVIFIPKPYVLFNLVETFKGMMQ